ncbi:MAG: aminopeptidase [Candidatus Nanosalina sp.]
MSLDEAANTIFDVCLDVKPDEEVLILDDGNDKDIIEALRKGVEERARLNYVNYPEPEVQGAEPPKYVAEALNECDVFVAPTNKSISHTRARSEATKAGVRGASMPKLTKEVMKTSVQADYQRVREISDKAQSVLKDSSEIRIRTPSGTNLTLDVEKEKVHKLDGILTEPGDFGNIPSGEIFGPGINARGKLVIDELAMAPEASGTEVMIEKNTVVDVKSDNSNKLVKKLEEIEGAKNIAEFGFGTNPEAEIIGNNTNDEKILGTVHIAFGDNEFFLPDGDDRIVESEIHWDSVCVKPTVYFDDRKMLDKGKPVFLED